MTRSANRHPLGEVLDMAPPHDLEAERYCLGAMLLDPSLSVSNPIALSPEDFHGTRERLFFIAIIDVISDGAPLEINELRRRMIPLKTWNASFFEELMHSAPTVAHWGHHCDLLKNLTAKRKTIRTVEQVLRAAHNGEAASEVLAKALSELELIQQSIAMPGTSSDYQLINLADVTPKPVSWLWSGKIALGKVTLISGDPGLGKSFVSLDLAARVSRGGQLPCSDEPAPEGAVVLLSAEDDLADTIRPRLDALGATVSRITALTMGCGERERLFDLSRDLPALSAAIERLGDCRLVIIDPISAYLGADTDSHKNTDVRAVLAPLASLATKYDLAIVAISHLNKDGHAKAVHRTSGSIAFVAAVRSGLMVIADKDDHDRRLLLTVKNNLGPDKTGLAFRLVTPHDDSLPVVEWEVQPVTITADEALAPIVNPRGPAPKKLEEAIGFLCSALADGARPSTEVQEEAQNLFRISKHTLERARKALSVKSFLRDGGWFIELPNTSKNATSLEQLGELGGLPDSSQKNG